MPVTRSIYFYYKSLKCLNILSVILFFAFLLEITDKQSKSSQKALQQQDKDAESFFIMTLQSQIELIVVIRLELQLHTHRHTSFPHRGLPLLHLSAHLTGTYRAVCVYTQSCNSAFQLALFQDTRQDSCVVNTPAYVHISTSRPK